MEKLSFTLYEVFGYFLPGTIGVAAIAVLFWALFLSNTAIPVESLELSKLWYVGLAIICYYSGHIVQMLSRSFFKNPDDSVLAREPHMALLVKRAQEQLAAHLGMSQAEMPGASLTVRLCDEVAVQYGQIGDRDVFVYREGFYRGSVAAFILLDIAFLVRCLIPGAALQLSTQIFAISRWQLVFIMGIVTCGIYLLFKRYKLFAALRSTRGILAYVSLTFFRDLSKKGEDVKKTAELVSKLT